MQSDYDSSISGYIADAFEGINKEFTDVEILNTSETNFVARAKRYGRWWLLKGLNKNVANEAAYQQRLRKELELLMQLQHPYVVNAVGLEQVGDLGNCIVMEYVEGKTLKQWLHDNHPRKERRRIAMEIADAVAYIHSKGIVHRDLKPENIIITENGNNVKLIDFGLADTDSHTILKQPAGTLKYMSPEQMQSAVADVRNDIYSLGIIFDKMRLGYTYIIKRCQRPIESRYQSMAELTDAIKRRNRRKSILAWVAFSLLMYILAGIVILQSIRVRELLQQAPISKQDQTEILKSVSSLSAGVEQITASNQKIEQRQQEQDAARQRINDAIDKGKIVIDNALKTTGMKQHLDTLKNLEYLNPNILNKLNEGNTACNQYCEKIKGNYTEKEMEEIKNTLFFYAGDKTKDLVLRYNKIKEAYDKTIMQGY